MLPVIHLIPSNLKRMIEKTLSCLIMRPLKLRGAQTVSGSGRQKW